MNGSPSVWAFAPGLLLIGLGVGVMLTPSVNVVQSSFPEERQGEISGLSRSVSNLGSCLGTAIGGTILVSGLTNRAYGLAMITLAAIGLIGLVAAIFLSSNPVSSRVDRTVESRLDVLAAGSTVERRRSDQRLLAAAAGSRESDSSTRHCR